MSTQNAEDYAARILVVENDPRWREDHLTNLTRWGYDAFVAQGEGQSLVKDAILKVNTYRCHIALVDMRLFDHDHRSDDSGLNLVPKLKPTESIIVSGYGDVHSVTRALLEKGARYFIGKEDGPRPLKQIIEDILQTICASKKEVEIEWPAGLSAQAIISRLFKEKAELIPIDQVNDVLALLFPEAKRIRLQTLDDTNYLSSSGPALHSVVLKVNVDERLQPEIVKISTPEDIEKQGKRYKKYIDGHLPGTFYTNLKAQAYLWDIGAARYDFLGAPNQNMATWAELYQTSQSVDEIMKPLHFFFDQLWYHYYNRADQESGHSLLEAYCGVWGVNWLKRLQPFSKDKYLKINILKLKVLNPIKWLLDKIDAENQLDERIPRTCLAITHGDFHGENLFVHEGRAWVINFERTGPGPIYQDFASLEANILIELAHIDKLNVFYEMVTILLTAPSADQIKLPSQFHYDEAQKALVVIKNLRKLAEKTIKKFNIEEYLSCLLFNCLFLISWPKLDPQQRNKALLLGGLICEQLDRELMFTEQIEGKVFSLGDLTGKQVKKDPNTIKPIEDVEYKISNYWQQLNLHTPRIDPDECRRMAYELGCLLYDKKRFKEALRAFEIGHQALEALRTKIEKNPVYENEQLAEENADLYARLVHCCVLTGDEDAAFEYALAGKSRGFVDSLKNEGFDLFAAIDNNPVLANDQRLIKYKKLLNDINSIRAKLQRLMNEESVIWDTLKSAYPTLTATQEASSMTVEEASQLAEDLSW